MTNFPADHPSIASACEARREIDTPEGPPRVAVRLCRATSSVWDLSTLPPVVVSDNENNNRPPSPSFSGHVLLKELVGDCSEPCLLVPAADFYLFSRMRGYDAPMPELVLHPRWSLPEISGNSMGEMRTPPCSGSHHDPSRGAYTRCNHGYHRNAFFQRWRTSRR